MKKSDIVIYASAVITLILTTFVVFSTQKVTYESKIDDILKKNTESTNEPMFQKDKIKHQDADSPLFKTKLPALKDEKQNDDMSKKEEKTQDTTSDPVKVVKITKTDTQTKPEKLFQEKKKQSVEKRSTSSSFDYMTPGTSSSKTGLTKTADNETVENAKRRITAIRKRMQAVKERKTAPRINTPVRRPSSVPATTSGSRIHVVKYGDTLWRIAMRYGTTTRKLIGSNRLANPNLIYPGMKIRIP